MHAHAVYVTSVNQSYKLDASHNNESFSNHCGWRCITANQNVHSLIVDIANCET